MKIISFNAAQIFVETDDGRKIEIHEDNFEIEINVGKTEIELEKRPSGNQIITINKK